MLRPYLSRVRPCTGPDPAQFDHMRPDLDPKLVQEHLAHRAAGHPGHRFPRARALQDVARVLPVVLERAREVRVAGPRTRHLAAPLAPRGVRFGGHQDRKSTRLNSSHVSISYAVFCLKKKTKVSPRSL